MSDINECSFSGNIGSTRVDSNKITFGLANGRWNGKEEITQWLNCTVWCKPESIGKQEKSLQTGNQVMVHGELTTYTDKDGVSRFGINVRNYKVGKYGKASQEGYSKTPPANYSTNPKPETTQGTVTPAETHYDEVPF